LKKFYLYFYEILFFQDIIRLIRQIIIALNTFHERNIIHRDVKIQNIFVDKDYNFKLSIVFLLFHFILFLKVIMDYRD
jgi:serine/threonine-protein kinase